MRDHSPRAARRACRRSIIPALLLAAVLLAACAPLPVSAPAAPAGAQSGPFDLTIVHSNDTWGYLDPCG